jgi:tetratricopeptide (TPR) repeat protein
MRVAACAIFLVLFAFSCARSAHSYLERGNVLFDGGNYQEAAFEYRVSLSKDPQGAEAYYRLGRTYIRLSRGSAALEAFQRAVHFAPNNEQYSADFADLSFEEFEAHPDMQRLYDQGAQIAYDLLRKDPNSFDGLRLRGLQLIIDRNYDGALQELHKADAIRPLDPTADVPIVQVLLIKNRSQEAVSLATRVLQAHPDSVQMSDVLAGYYQDSHRLADEEHLLESEISALPARAEARLQLATLYHDTGRRQQMEAVLDGIRKEHARFPNAALLVGNFYSGHGEWEAALREYQDGGRSDAKNRQLYEKGTARALAALGKTNAAVDELTGLLKRTPGDSSARLARAILRRDSPVAAERNEAIADLKTLSKAAPKDPVTRYNLGLAYVANGDFESGSAQLKAAAALQADYSAPRIALAELAERTGDHAETIRLTEQALSTEPDNVAAALLHASGLIGTGNYSLARSELKTLLTSHPDSMDVNLRLAVLDTAEQKYSDAETRLRRLNQRGSGDVRPLQGLVYLYLKEKQTAKADALLDRELAANSSSAEVHRLAANSAAQEGNRGRAIQQYEWLRANTPASVDVLKALGGLYRDQGDLPQAVASYQKASELAPGDEDILSNLAVLQGHAGQLQAAIATLKRELVLAPNDAAAMNNLAFDLAETGTDLDHALTLAATAARQLSDNPNVLDTLGWVYVKHGLNESAISVFQVLVKKNPNFPEYHYHLGMAFLQAKQLEQAKSEFARALSQNPPEDLAQKIRQAGARL